MSLKLSLFQIINNRLDFLSNFTQQVRCQYESLRCKLTYCVHSCRNKFQQNCEMVPKFLIKITKLEHKYRGPEIDTYQCLAKKSRFFSLPLHIQRYRSSQVKTFSSCTLRTLRSRLFLEEKRDPFEYNQERKVSMQNSSRNSRQNARSDCMSISFSLGFVYSWRHFGNSTLKETPRLFVFASSKRERERAESSRDRFAASRESIPRGQKKERHAIPLESLFFELSQAHPARHIIDKHTRVHHTLGRKWLFFLASRSVLR